MVNTEENPPPQGTSKTAPQPVQMETDPVVERPKTNRVLVSVEDPSQMIPEARRNQYKPDATTKAACITALVHIHVRLAALFNMTTTQLLNISYSMQLTSIVSTIHSILRQQANPKNVGKISEKVNKFTMMIAGKPVDLTKAAGLAAMKEVFLAYGLDYDTQPFPAPWFGVMALYLTFMSCFKHRMYEIRTGVGKFPVGKTPDGDVRVADLGQFGLNSSHHIHCEGITYPPMKRSSISLGPLAQLIMLNQSRKAPMYADKWKKAAARSLAHIPNHQALINHIFTHDAATVSSYIATIGDLLTITGSRSSIKAYFPFSFYVAILDQTSGAMMHEAPKAATQGHTPVYTKATVPAFAEIDHSGRGAFLFYNKAAACYYTFNLDSDAAKAAAIVFHSAWGSHLEDINVLEYMTGVVFPTRHDLGNAFRGKGSCIIPLAFQLPRINIYAKLSQALSTDKTSGGQQQVWNRVTFTGKRRAELTSDFKTYLKKRKMTTTYAALTGNLYPAPPPFVTVSFLG